MNKRSLVTLLVVAGMTATVQADENPIYLLGVNENPGLDLNLENGISADVGPIGVGLRGGYSDEDNYQTMKNNQKRKKYTGPCDCADITRQMKQLEKSKDTRIILNLGIRNSKYRKLQKQFIDCGCERRAQ